MVNRELIEVFSEIAREKNVERSELASILEELFLYIIEREYGDSSNCSCIVNLDKGEIEIYAEKTIVEEIDDYKVEQLEIFNEGRRKLRSAYSDGLAEMRLQPEDAFDFLSSSDEEDADDDSDSTGSEDIEFSYSTTLA